MREEAQSTLFLVTIKAILFCLSVSFFLSTLYFYKEFHENTKKEVRNNDTIFVNDSVPDDIILDISDVVHEILIADNNVNIAVNGRQITSHMRKQMLDNKTAINLYLPSSGSYKKNYIYNSNGKLSKIEYLLVERN